MIQREGERSDLLLTWAPRISIQLACPRGTHDWILLPGKLYVGSTFGFVEDEEDGRKRPEEEEALFG